MPTFDWIDVKSKSVIHRRVADYSEDDFDASAEWQDYLWDQFGPRPPTYLTLKIADTATDYEFKGGCRKNGKIVATATVPTAWFDGASAEANRTVFRRVKGRFFADLAAAADLPPPPPLPPKLPPREDKFAPPGGTAWLSERKGFKAPHTQVSEWFFADPAWQEYLPRTDFDMYSIVDCIVDRDDIVRSYSRKRNGEVTIGVDIPSELFVRNYDPELTLVEIARETYVWGMERFGWPEPPPVPARPPGHEPRTRPINENVR